MDKDTTKKIIWTALLTLATTASASLAARMLSGAWSKVMHEEPPLAPNWARLLLGVPVKKAVEVGIGPTE